jgi:peptide chain release factor subunit 3
MDCVLEGGKWSRTRYDDIVTKLKPFLKSCGYSTAKDLVFLPIAALGGENVVGKCKSEVCDWWDGPTLFEALDATEPPTRDPMASFRMPVMDRYKDMGTIVMGKSESGVIQVCFPAEMTPKNFCLPLSIGVLPGDRCSMYA